MPPSRPALLAASSAVPRSRATRPYAVYGGGRGERHLLRATQLVEDRAPMPTHRWPRIQGPRPQPCSASLNHAPYRRASREPSLPGLPTSVLLPGRFSLVRFQEEVICLDSSNRVSRARPGQGCDRLRRQGLERTDLASPASHILPDFSGVGTLATDFPGTRSSPPPTAGSHVVNTNCSAVHTRQALCCKMAVEYDKFIESGRKYVVAVPCLLQAQGQCRARPLVRAHCRFLHTPPGGSATWMTTTT